MKRPIGIPKPRASLTLGILALGMALSLSACAPTRKAPPPDKEAVKQQELHIEQRAFIAHEFFLRARQQEMEGNDAVALSYFQIAYEYDPESRDLCFLLTDKLKTMGRIDSALVTGLKCLELKGGPSSHDYQTVAEIELRKGDIQNALSFYNKAMDLDGDDKDLLYTLATLYESLKDLPRHIAVMEKLLPKIDYPLRLVEKLAQNYRLLGKVDAQAKLYQTAWDRTGNAAFGEKLASFYEDQEMFASLLDVLRKLAKDYPDNLQYRLQKARAFILADQPDSAITAYEELIKQSPEEREFLSPYATLLYEKRRFAEAKQLFQKLSKGQPDNPVYHFFIGSTAMELKEKALTESELKKAIDLDGKVPEYWAKLASYYIREGQEQKALDLLAKTGEGKDWYADYIKGIVYTQVGKKLEADLRSAADGKSPAGPNPDTVLLAKARGFRLQGVEFYRKALELEGNNRRVLFELGIAQEQLGDRSASIETMKRLVKLDSSDATILNYLGYQLVEEEKELDLAASLIGRALQMEPENGAFLDSKGWMYYKKKDFPQARKFIEQALQRMPQDTTILEHYALILEKLGQTQAAQEKWRLILKLDPDHALAHRKVN